MNGRFASVLVTMLWVICLASACGGGGDTPGECVPSCETKECGDDGCGGVCGACSGVAPYCVNNQCSVECVPDCTDSECGEDGCGGTCGACPSDDLVCVAGSCVSEPTSITPGVPVANISPKIVAFGKVNKGDSPVKSVTVTNTGSEYLVIHQILFQAWTDFSLIYEMKTYQPGIETIQLAEPVVIKSTETAIFSVQFAPETMGSASGTLVFFSNDPTQPSGTKVELSANELGPCIQVNPKKVEFGGKEVGMKAVLPVEIIDCGTAPSDVINIQLVEGSDDDFQLDTTSLVGFEDGSAVSFANPLEIPVNGSATLNVNYVPSEESTLSADGLPVFDIGTILIESNAFESSLEIEVSGLGVTKE